ncbi:uncharacterized protein CCR75_003147 [Bremia lactucae]|uniref:Uncharacterized protein n=1 Tax=Bremia lactucae TaxID=4779 RepID=A0A976IHK8_BRELC|nr:hypothetical protein CCR75_003147 [Bremia lactucae]
MSSWINAAVDRLRQHFSGDRSIDVYKTLAAHVVDATTGGALFIGGTSVAQVAQKLLRVGSATGFLLPQALGAVAVASSSVLALHFASIPRSIYQEMVAQRRQTSDHRWLVLEARNIQPTTPWRLLQSEVQERWSILSQSPDLVYMTMGLLCFKLLGGRMSALAPSPLANLGAFHLRKASLPATIEYATSVERGIIQEFGRLYGCHTCGAKRGVRYHADHMPPKLMASRTDAQFLRNFFGRKTKFRFYPQCESCSNLQGNVVKHWKSTLKMHLLSFRAYHATGLWLILLCSGGLYVNGSTFHKTFERIDVVDDAAESCCTSLDRSLLVSLRKREQKLRYMRRNSSDITQIAVIDKELKAINECKIAIKASIERQMAHA